jgi:hypothetical protein
MKRAFLLGAVLTCAATVALAAGGTKVINKSNFDIDHLYVSAPGKDTWSADLMEGVKDAIDAGKTEVVPKLEAGTFDLKMVDDDEAGAPPCIVKNVTIKAGKPLTLTKAQTKGCK